jgi:flagellar motor component MotA
MPGADQNSYDIDASTQVQDRVNQLSAQISSLITQHETNVKALLSDATMTNVTDSYREVETKFSKAAQDVLNIIRLLTDTMKDNDETARTALKQAQASVDAIPR